MGSWWDRIRQFFGAAPPPTPRVQPPPPPAPPTERSGKFPARPPLTVLPGGLDKETPFDQLVTWLGLSPPDRLVLTQADLDGDEALAVGLLEHFRKNRPAPSSLPAISLQVLNAIAEPDLSLSELSRLVAQDPALAAGVLKVANSPAYMGAQEIQTLRDAVTRLGLTEVGRVAGMVAARSLFQPQVRGEFATFSAKWSELFTDSVTAARGSAWLSMRLRKGRSDHVFVAGMLHDLGRPVALRSIAALAMGGQTIDAHRVDRVLEQVHVEVGGEVHQAWSLPRFPTLVAMRHHDLNLPSDGEYVDVHVVRLVSALIQFRRSPWRFETIRNEVNQSCAALGVDAFVLRSLDTQLKDEQAHVGHSFSDKGRRKVG
jgi:HD-like signal output (HDOD) protein